MQHVRILTDRASRALSEDVGLYNCDPSNPGSPGEQCDATAWDQCRDYNWIGCTGTAEDICGQDEAACVGNQTGDICLETDEWGAFCYGAILDDICDEYDGGTSCNTGDFCTIDTT